MIITFKPYNIIKQIYYKYSKNNKKKIEREEEIEYI